MSSGSGAARRAGMTVHNIRPEQTMLQVILPVSSVPSEVVSGCNGLEFSRPEVGWGGTYQKTL